MHVWPVGQVGGGKMKPPQEIGVGAVVVVGLVVGQESPAGGAVGFGMADVKPAGRRIEIDMNMLIL